jgi:hypothetical protein
MISEPLVGGSTKRSAHIPIDVQHIAQSATHYAKCNTLAVSMCRTSEKCNTLGRANVPNITEAQQVHEENFTKSTALRLRLRRFARERAKEAKK